jgi:hypothetical protein
MQIYSRGQKKVGQCFFANVNLLALCMVTIKIFILVIYYSNPGFLYSILAKFRNKTCPTFFCPRLYIARKQQQLTIYITTINVTDYIGKVISIYFVCYNFQIVMQVCIIKNSV